MAPGLCQYGGRKAPQSSGSTRGERPRWASSQGCTCCLCRKVFHKLGLTVSEEEIRKVVVNTPGAIEPILCAVRDKVEACEGLPGMAGHKRSGPGCAASSKEHVPLPTCDGETPAGLRTRIGSAPPGGLMSQRWSPLQEAGRSSGDAGLRSPLAHSGVETHWSQRAPEKMGHCACRGCPAREPWHHLDPGLPQRLLEEKEQALTVLQETIKVLQMKVTRLEHLVKLKDQRIEALTRQGDQPRGGGTPGRKGPLPCPPDSDPEPTWKSPRLGVSGCGHALSIRLGAQRRARASVSTSRGLAPPDCTSRVPSQCGLRFPCCPPPPCHLPPPRPVWI
ncbi:uncharacterized protein [Muntiacus reevesi]|uniref:uncharacterized protein n=1 Tax=Muntiacus reevesi TaxID=9886 RepID=UPI003306E434